jgi:hypothetical protein
MHHDEPSLCRPMDPFPNLTIQANWETTNEIIHSIRQLGTTPFQDGSIPYEALPLNAQLNVNADEEAGIYQHTYPAQHPWIPCLLSNLAQLHINGKVIPSKLKKWICEAFTDPPYLAYLQDQFQWTAQCTETVGWTACTQAIRQFSTWHIQIIKLCTTKLCNDLLLPTTRWANMYDALTTDHCLHCGEPEDQDHMLLCTYAPHCLW